MLPVAWLQRLGTIGILLVACLLLSGCGKQKPLTKADFDKIKVGMSLKDVEEILGDGTQIGGDGSNVAGQFGVDVQGVGSAPPVDYEWEHAGKKITITFTRAKVSKKSSTGL